MPFIFKLAGLFGSIALIRIVIDYLQPKYKPKYGVKDRVIIVTGSNSGIGFETAKELYKEGAIVIFACRNEVKAKEAMDKIERQCKKNLNVGKLIFIKLDLNSFKSVHEFVDTINKKELNIFSLINNAGIYSGKLHLNEDGYEEHLMVNHFGHQLLNELLLPNLVKNGTEIMPTKIIFVTSLLYKAGMINDNFFKPFAITEEQFNKTNMYSNSKLASLLYARKLSEKVAESNYNLYINLASPGFVKTNLGRDMKHKWLRFILGGPILLFLIRTPKQGAQTILQCTLGNNLSSNGKFYRKCKEGEFARIANDTNLMDKVFKLTRQVIGIKE